ncbi:hypothetical protein EI42_04506 [Thermosporothrix hazakensis]|jgi:hypothetical protein|uniref:Uncharacterized protein n=2 Tax=Thermosporothrix TaxID=768650 RepID=A0A326UAU8_THEHA|nr:hypothetical protein [Thermosporothrix hazakensis]PZW24898.1 hypothetical protein EI42_04506 [Thermosporothrix hazakensis]BBH88230.1 hypothetical protein KTC_29810 [Thermosporothrix sp. COM3]GCE46415.1 hypothetical protein KTH_12840 [Thermosporothrix hazakensis]
MDEQQNEPFNEQKLVKEYLRSLTNNAMLFNLFAAFWAFMALPSTSGLLQLAIGIGLFSITIAFCLITYRVRHRLRPIPRTLLFPEGSQPEPPSLRKSYSSVFLLESLLVFVVLAVLLMEHQERFLLSAFGLISGLHFLPLGALYRLRVYYVSGITITLLASIIILLQLAGVQGELLLVLSLGIAAILWLTTLYALRLAGTIVQEIRSLLTDPEASPPLL